MKKETKPRVGDFATYSIGSDRYAVYIQKIERNGKTVYVSMAKSKRIDKNGQSENQTYEHSAPDHGTKASHVFTLRKDGSYLSRGQNCGRLTLGVVNMYLDPGF